MPIWIIRKYNDLAILVCINWIIGCWFELLTNKSPLRYPEQGPVPMHCSLKKAVWRTYPDIVLLCQAWTKFPSPGNTALKTRVTQCKKRNNYKKGGKKSVGSPWYNPSSLSRRMNVCTPSGSLLLMSRNMNCSFSPSGGKVHDVHRNNSTSSREKVTERNNWYTGRWSSASKVLVKWGCHQVWTQHLHVSYT